MLTQEGLAPAEAEALAMRTIILASAAPRGSDTFGSIDPPDPYQTPDPIHIPPPPPPPPRASGSLIVDVDLATIHVYGEEVALDDLDDKVSSLKSRLGFEHAEVQSHPDVPYERLIRVLDAVRAGGIDDVAFSARP
jgi:biopolymer transport protein ExbD